ncbi:MAG TPA: hypothetical protein VJ937_11020 [Salinivirga sp.]|uniref:hypothetical protein n=1 Tax=Salinivirga sp. TaxID=1970192 RepID=UPI002B4A951C|nr:hypothetical protein [Salinivirga sp.]HKK60002.1 hypothetical protein [Salinivirga sp.]
MKKMNIVQFLGIFLILFTAFSSSAVAQEEEKKDGFKIGGAVRYNIISTDYESDPTTLSTSATWDTWRLNVDGTMKGLDLSFEYRFYPTFATHFMHHGWIGYNFNDVAYMKLGVSQVPFGITKFASHSWWFQGPYYVGLEDDYDMGIKFDLNFVENLDLAVAYYRQAEPQGPASGGVNWTGPGAGRYSYDITPGSGGVVNDGTGMVDTVTASIRELNQFNVRAAYHITEDIEIGASGQFGQTYNSTLDDSEMSMAIAGHVVANFGNFNFKGEFVNYNYGAKSDTDQDLDIVQMGAYGSSYNVATEANMYVAGLAYSIPVEWGPITNIQPYVDFTLIDKANEDFYDTQHLVPGFLITAGSIYTYVDYAMGKNQPWLTDSFGLGLGQGVEDPEWNKRFNINIGYYF